MGQEEQTRDVAAMLRRYRRETGIGRDEFAAAVGVSTSLLAQIERGSRAASNATIRKTAERYPDLGRALVEARLAEVVGELGADPDSIAGHLEAALRNARARGLSERLGRLGGELLEIAGQLRPAGE